MAVAAAAVAVLAVMVGVAAAAKVAAIVVVLGAFWWVSFRGSMTKSQDLDLGLDLSKSHVRKIAKKPYSGTDIKTFHAYLFRLCMFLS